MSRIRNVLLIAVGLGLTACGGDDGEPEPAPAAEPCNVGGQTGCEANQRCEQVQGGEPACFAPVSVSGRVFDTADDAAIEGARVVVRDSGDAVVSAVAVSDPDGHYTIQVPAPRDAEGSPLASQYTLRADAAGYLTFPRAPRVALPVSLADTNAEGVVENPTTDLGLIPLDDSSGLGSVSGAVEGDNAGGTLVVAGTVTGVADADGSYTVFSVPSGSVTVRGYRQGVSYNPADADVQAGEETGGVDLTVAGEASAVVSGTIQLVNAGGASATSVLLVVAATFEENAARGEAPAGLRAPEVSGAWSIEGVPPGGYVVLAAFENDRLVRDPDTSIGGTEIQRVTVAEADVEVPGFKITGALDVFFPGADGPEEVDGADLAFEWEDDSSEDGYQVQVFDAFGAEVWMTEGAFDQGGNKPASVAYGGPSLESGMYYQFRATSIKDGVPISRTEDLEGVFIAR